MTRTREEVERELLNGRLLPVARRSKTLRMLQAGSIEVIREYVDDLGLLAADWAVAIAGTDAKPRTVMIALRRCQNDPDVRAWVSTLLGCLENEKKRDELVDLVAQDALKTVMCTCGRKFTSILAFKAHLETDCPDRKKT